MPLSAQICVTVFENAASAAYPDGWRDYRCVASYDRQHWFRIAATRYENGELIVKHTPERDSVYYAYFEPYSHERHLDMIARAAMSPSARGRRLGLDRQRCGHRGGCVGGIGLLGDVLVFGGRLGSLGRLVGLAELLLQETKHETLGSEGTT